MNQTTLLILCFFPILLIPILIYASRMHKFIALLLGCFVAGIIAMFFWKVSIYQVAGAFVQGLWKSGMVLLAMWSAAPSGVANSYRKCLQLVYTGVTTTLPSASSNLPTGIYFNSDSFQQGVVDGTVYLPGNSDFQDNYKPVEFYNNTGILLS